MSDVTKRPAAEVAAISAALMRLAAATRDTSLDALTVAVYLSNLDAFEVNDIVATCRAMESTEQWFPKVRELVAAVAKTRYARKQSAQRQLAASVTVVDFEDEASRRTRDKWLARLRETVKGGRHVG